MPIKIESQDVTMENLIDLFQYLEDLGVPYTLHIEMQDEAHHNPTNN